MPPAMVFAARMAERSQGTLGDCRPLGAANKQRLAEYMSQFKFDFSAGEETRFNLESINREEKLENIALRANWLLENCIYKPDDFFEMLIGSYQFRSLFHRLGGDPDVIGWNWSPLLFKLGCNS